MLKNNINHITLNGVSVKINNKLILDRINLNLNTKESYIALLGANGAGKTVLLKTILGLFQKTSGSIVYHSNLEHEFDPLTCLDFVFQNPVFLDRTLEDNLNFYFKSKYDNYQDLVNLAVSLVGLGGKLKKNINELSGGEQKKVAFIRSALMPGNWLFLDEAFTNLDPNAYKLIESIIINLVRHGLPKCGIQKKTCFFVAHSLKHVEKLANKVVFLANGKIIFSGKKHDFFMSKNSAIVDYLKFS